MPIYEYICNQCDEELEVIRKISESSLKECPRCHEDTLVKKTSMSAFHLKGGGWYKDGYSNSQNDKKTNKTSSPAAKTDNGGGKAKADNSTNPSSDKSSKSNHNLPSSKAS